ncbi:GspH/FimT family protein [Craterilacuibacter sp. RT1T]|uniref:GspH/FimT family pseudopilin n=1 Tax=Craterilacuibacter sp. RT1T TaxID=2942211 RepID=UPI0020BDC8CB|nr:GspH/FimT family protein [Craterilacuibacter sp. RT1T]MCL6264282.1 GspH/FimT family protein [Craterilacuibacter sp. RT1T]
MHTVHFAKQPAQGLTLIELLLTLSILAIMLAMALPAFGPMVANHKAKSASQSLVSALNLARSEAIKRGHEVSICPLADGNSARNCLTDGWGNALSNEAGIWVFDDQTLPLLALEDSTQRIQQLAPAKTGISLSASNNIKSGISYLADGSVKQAGSLKVVVPGAARCLKLAANGRLTLLTVKENDPC